MRVQTKVKLVMSSIVVCCVAISSLILVGGLNSLLGEEIPTGETYISTYSYCGAWSGAGGQNHCTLWLTGQEKRERTIVHGYWWETTSSRIAK